MLTTDDLKPEHFGAFVPIDLQKEEFDHIVSFLLSHEEKLPHQHTFFKDDVPVLIAGMYEIWPGVFSTYTLFSKAWKVMYYKHVAKFYRTYFKTVQYDRIQHTVSADRPWTNKMAELFGFVNETPNAPLRKYMDGKDYYMYALVREDGA